MSNVHREIHEIIDCLTCAQRTRLDELLEKMLHEERCVWARAFRAAADDIEECTDTSTAPRGLRIAANMISPLGDEIDPTRSVK